MKNTELRFEAFEIREKDLSEARSPRPNDALTPFMTGATFPLMHPKNFEKLEELLRHLIKEARSLRAGNRKLQEENAHLGVELEKANAEAEKYRTKLEKLAALERACQKMESGNATIRLKVQNMLAELEKVDWS